MVSGRGQSAKRARGPEQAAWHEIYHDRLTSTHLLHDRVNMRNGMVMPTAHPAGPLPHLHRMDQMGRGTTRLCELLQSKKCFGGYMLKLSRETRPGSERQHL